MVEEKISWLLSLDLLPHVIIIGRNLIQDFIRDNPYYAVENNRTVYKGIQVYVSLEFPEEVIVSI